MEIRSYLSCACLISGRSQFPIPNTAHVVCQKLWPRFAVSGAIPCTGAVQRHSSTFNLLYTYWGPSRCGHQFCLKLFPNSSTESSITHSLLDSRCLSSRQRNMPGYIPCSWIMRASTISDCNYYPLAHAAHLRHGSYDISKMLTSNSSHLAVSGPISFHWCGSMASPLDPKHEFCKSDRPSDQVSNILSSECEFLQCKSIVSVPSSRTLIYHISQIDTL
jgi:hypothetical protein